MKIKSVKRNRGFAIETALLVAVIVFHVVILGLSGPAPDPDSVIPTGSTKI
jgi:hypothetical protein